MNARKTSTDDVGARPRGRPRRDIDPDAVADAVAALFTEGGLEAVSIVDVADRLNVSRATLYRTIPTRDDLLGILFERSTRELLDSARTVAEENTEPRERLDQLIRLHIDAAIRMRGYMPVFFGGGDLPSEVFDRWHTFSRDYEALWTEVVAENMKSGYLIESDAVVATRLLLGACIWVSRWYRADGQYDPQLIADTAVNLLRQGVPRPR